MSDIQTEQFKQQLEESREELVALQGARDQSTATVKLDQSAVGRLSRMDALQQQAMAQSNQRRVDLAIRQIEAALRRIEDGSYGYCLHCDELTNPKRLALDPATPLCVECAGKRDS